MPPCLLHRARLYVRGKTPWTWLSWSAEYRAPYVPWALIDRAVRYVSLGSWTWRTGSVSPPRTKPGHEVQHSGFAIHEWMKYVGQKLYCRLLVWIIVRKRHREFQNGSCIVSWLARECHWMHGRWNDELTRHLCARTELHPRQKYYPVKV